jgi:hypothetical protein
METQFDIPILYTVFNRLDVVKQTFSEIKKIKPKQLFIGADGPRNYEEKKETDSVRKYILENINWKCKVKTLFFEKNLGVNMATFKEIDWFFKNVEKGIVLEDDDLPSRSFFLFCKEMLIRYEKNPKVMTISGFTPIETPFLKESYYFAKNFGCWGWATWRDRWQKTNLLSSDFEKIEKEKKLNKIFKNPIERIILRRKFRYNLIGKVKGWDYAFSFLHYKNNAISIKSKKNLVKNLGFIDESTNTSNNFLDRKFLCIKASDLNFPLIHPKKIEINKSLSNKELRTDILRSLLKRILVTLRIIKYNYSY